MIAPPLELTSVGGIHEGTERNCLTPIDLVGIDGKNEKSWSGRVVCDPPFDMELNRHGRAKFEL